MRVVHQGRYIEVADDKTGPAPKSQNFRKPKKAKAGPQLNGEKDFVIVEAGRFGGSAKRPKPVKPVEADTKEKTDK